MDCECDNLVIGPSHHCWQNRGAHTVQPNATYASYLLRLRQVRNDEHLVWVASIQSTASDERRSFPSVNALVRFLESEYGECDARCGGSVDAACDQGQ
jgi:hypothetical protein